MLHFTNKKLLNKLINFTAKNRTLVLMPININKRIKTNVPEYHILNNNKTAHSTLLESFVEAFILFILFIILDILSNSFNLITVDVGFSFVFPHFLELSGVPSGKGEAKSVTGKSSRFTVSENSLDTAVFSSNTTATAAASHPAYLSQELEAQQLAAEHNLRDTIRRQDRDAEFFRQKYSTGAAGARSANFVKMATMVGDAHDRTTSRWVNFVNSKKDLLGSPKKGTIFNSEPSPTGSTFSNNSIRTAESTSSEHASNNSDHFERPAAPRCTFDGSPYVPVGTKDPRWEQPRTDNTEPMSEQRDLGKYYRWCTKRERQATGYPITYAEARLDMFAVGAEGPTKLIKYWTDEGLRHSNPGSPKSWENDLPEDVLPDQLLERQLSDGVRRQRSYLKWSSTHVHFGDQPISPMEAGFKERVDEYRHSLQPPFNFQRYYSTKKSSENYFCGSLKICKETTPYRGQWPQNGAGEFVSYPGPFKKGVNGSATLNLVAKGHTFLFAVKTRTRVEEVVLPPLETSLPLDEAFLPLEQRSSSPDKVFESNDDENPSPGGEDPHPGDENPLPGGEDPVIPEATTFWNQVRKMFMVGEVATIFWDKLPTYLLILTFTVLFITVIYKLTQLFLRKVREKDKDKKK